MKSWNTVGSNVSTLSVRQLLTSVDFALPSFSFVSSLTFTSGSGDGFDSECRPEWSENLYSVCDSTFTFGGALLGLCTCLGVWSRLRLFLWFFFFSTVCILLSFFLD